VGTLVRLPAALDAQMQRDAGISHYEYFVLAGLSMAAGRTLRMSDLAEFIQGALPRLSNVVESAPGHVEEVRRLVFDPLTKAQHKPRLAGPSAPRAVKAASPRSYPPRPGAFDADHGDERRRSARRGSQASFGGCSALHPGSGERSLVAGSRRRHRG
jgi:hypothetical protein